MNRRRLKKRLSRRNLVLIALVVGLSVYQLATQGSITWPQALLARVDSYINRDEAGWKRASEQINDSVPAESAPRSFDIEGRVVRVFDGDTVSVLDRRNTQYKIRLFAIDSPEWDQPYGKAAKRELTQLVDGKQVGVKIADTDPYGRKVGELWLGDTKINREMVARGYAWWYQYHGPGEHDLREAEKAAQAEGRGLWAGDSPMAPWDWRRQSRRN